MGNSEQVLQEVQYLNKYARYNYSAGKREAWPMTVQRTVDYLRKQTGNVMTDDEYNDIFFAIFNREVSPSMRLMATAGKGADANQVGIYNCSFLPLSCPKDMYDLTLLLGHGVGVGFSVESRYAAGWPEVSFPTGTVINFVVPDDIEGWAFSFYTQLLNTFDGMKVVFDYSRIRPAGSPLLTRGGTASGYESLERAHVAIQKVLDKRVGRELSSLDIFDIACHIAGAIVSGGVRRSAMIAIFDRHDREMLNSKSGEWYVDNLQRQYANISQVINEKMSLDEWRQYVNLMDFNKSGEPGIWSRYAIKQHLPKRRKYLDTMGPNPCVEQILRPYQFCNLSQIIARSDDTLESLERKIRLAAVIGTIQSSMQDFKHVGEEFTRNAEEERLLGVSISGIMDCPILSGGDKKTLEFLKAAAIDENKKWAARLGINESTSVTCVKPDGNTSVLYDSAPGVHGRFAPYYIRRMRVQYGTPVANFAIAAGIPAEPAFGETWDNCKTLVLSFPVKSPEGAVIQRERSAVEQLDNWLKFKKYFVETNPSVTIGYRPDELEEIAQWLFKHQDHTIGLSFLPIDDNSYAQMPYEEISAEQYVELSKVFDTVNMKDFWKFENSNSDTTETAANLACVAGACLI
jgi:ribonucleoside-triphosphate reductase